MLWRKKAGSNRRSTGANGKRKRLLPKICLAFLIGALFGLLFLTGGRPEPQEIPADDQHRPFLEALTKGEVRLQVEKRCPSCHGPQGTPLSADHPLPEQCLLCHPAK